MAKDFFYPVDHFIKKTNGTKSIIEMKGMIGKYHSISTHMMMGNFDKMNNHVLPDISLRF